MAFWCVTKARSGQIHALAQKYHLWLDWIVLLSCVSLNSTTSHQFNPYFGTLLSSHPAPVALWSSDFWSSLFNQLQFCLGFRRHLGGATYRSQRQNSSLVEIQSHLRLQRPKKDKKPCKEQRCKNGMYIKCFPIKDPKIAFNFRVSVWHWGRTGYSLQQPVQSLTKLDLLSPVSKSFNPISEWTIASNCTGRVKTL